MSGDADPLARADFVRQWGPGICYKRISHSCKNFPDHITSWTIHGLWPSEDAFNWPSDCAARCGLSRAALTDLLEELHRVWPTAFRGGDTKFWRHEFCKHGTCATDVYPDVHDYFAATLAFHRALSIDDAFAEAGIVPDINSTFTFEQLDEALATSFGPGRAGYWCRWVKEGEQSRQLLWQVSTCVDRQGTVIDCPAGKTRDCARGQPLYLLPWTVLDLK